MSGLVSRADGETHSDAYETFNQSHKQNDSEKHSQIMQSHIVFLCASCTQAL